MDGINDLDIVPPCQFGDGLADTRDAAAKRLPAMRGHQDQPSRRNRARARDGGERAAVELRCDVQHRVDAGIACDKHPRRGRAFRQQVAPGRLGRREVEGCQAAGYDAVELFRKRPRHVAGAEPRFDVRYRNMAVERRERGRHGRRSVALNGDHRGLVVHENGIESGQHPRGDLRKALSRRHEVQVVIGADTEASQDLVEQRPVLRSDADARLNPAAGGESSNDGGQLDCFGARSEDKEDRFHESTV